MDERLRSLERRALATSDQGDFLAWWAARARSGAGGIGDRRGLVVWAARRVYSVVRWMQRFNEAAQRARQTDAPRGRWPGVGAQSMLQLYLERMQAELEARLNARCDYFRRTLGRYTAVRGTDLPSDRSTILAEILGDFTMSGWTRTGLQWAFANVPERARRPRRTTPIAGAPVTVLSRAQDRGVLLEQGQLMWAGRRAATAYRTAHNRDPGRTPEVGPNGAQHDVYCYTAADLAMVDEAIDAEERGDPRTGLGGGRRRVEPPANTPCPHAIPVGGYCYPCGGMVGSERVIERQRTARGRRSR